MQRQLLIVAILLSITARGSDALADGGTLQLSRDVGDFRISVFTSPALPRVGTVDVSILLQEATGTARTDVPIAVRLTPLAEQGIPQETTATTAAVTNRLFQAAQFEVPQPGPWRAIINIGTQNSATVSFDWEIAPPLPPWRQLLPWVSWPFGAMGLFLLDQSLAARRKNRRTARLGELH